MRTRDQYPATSHQWLNVASCLVAAVLLAGCATPPAKPADPALSRLASAGRAMFDRGSPDGAARLYVRALDKARAADDPREIGMAAYNLGACLIELEQYEEARGFLKEAELELKRADLGTAGVILLDAKALRLAGRYDEAVKRADAVLPAAAVGDKDSCRVQVHLLKAHIACDRGEAGWAHQEMGKAQDALEKMSDVMLEAEAAGVEGRLFLLDQAPEKAGNEFDRQAGLYRKAGKHRAMALALGRAGQAYTEANDPFHAGDRFYRSARCLFAQGDDVGALKMLDAGLAAAEKSQDEDSIARAAALFKEIRKRTEDALSAAAPAAEPAP